MAQRVRRPRKERFDLDKVEPIRLQPKADDDEIEQIHVFSIGDRDYFMPTEVPFHHALKAMDILAEKGEAAAVQYELRVTLGEEAYRALVDFPDLDQDQFEAIATLANRIVMASQKGKAR